MMALIMFLLRPLLRAVSPPAKNRCSTSFATNGAGCRRSWTGRWTARAPQSSQRRDFSLHPRKRSRTAARTSAGEE